MSRNKEKANSLLHRYYNQKQEMILPTTGTPRPRRVQSVNSIPVAEKFRSFVIREISTKVTKINDPSISESEIRDLNDQINKLIKEKLAWEYHIRDLGGADYIVFSKRQLSRELRIRDYRYFGRAKELPDVKEFLKQKQTQEQQKSKRSLTDPLEVSKYVAKQRPKLDLIDYYNLPRGVKLSQNPTAEELNEAAGALPQFKYAPEALGATTDPKRQKMAAPDEDETFDEFNPPSMQDIEKLLVERKKQELRRRLGMK